MNEGKVAESLFGIKPPLPPVISSELRNVKENIPEQADHSNTQDIGCDSENSLKEEIALEVEIAQDRQISRLVESAEIG